MRKYAPFLSNRWWILHSIGIAAVYAIGHLLVEGNPATDAELLKRVGIRDGVIVPGA